MAYAHLQVQFVCAPCVYMANVSQHENKSCGRHITTKAHMCILPLVIQQLEIWIYHTSHT
jgi:hypothetical protein